MARLVLNVGFMEIVRANLIMKEINVPHVRQVIMDFHLVKVVNAIRLEVLMDFVTAWVNVVAELDSQDKNVTNVQLVTMGKLVQVRLSYEIHGILKTLT